MVSQAGYMLGSSPTITSFIKTLRRASVLISDLQFFVVSICIALRSPERALVTGKACYLLLCLFFVVITYVSENAWKVRKQRRKQSS